MRIVVLVTLVCSLLSAAPIADLFNTGLGSPGGVDPHWTLNGGEAFVTGQDQFPYPPWTTSVEASWISPKPQYTGTSDDADTTVIFATVFNLPAQFNFASIVMRLASDNALEDIKLNGKSLDYSKSPVMLYGNTITTNVILEGTGYLTGLGAPLSITSGFQAGENKLEFHVRNSATNAANDGNPTGLIAAFNSDVTGNSDDVSESPEPANVVLFGSGLAFFGWVAAMRRCKHTNN